MTILRHVAAALVLLTPLSVCYAQDSSPKPVVPAAAGPVNMVVFSDFECPYSAQLFFTLQRLQARYPKQLHIIYKQSPLPIHPDAPLAHRAALAAQMQGRYDAMAELLYANQKPHDVASLTAYARQLHLDVPRFQRDLNSNAVTTKLNDDMQESLGFGVDLTPTLFVNGKILQGIQTEPDLAALIDKAAAKSAADDADATPLEAQTLDPALLAQIEAAPMAVRGSPNAPLTVVEFTDFQCPYCRAAVDPMEQFVASRGSDIRWIVRAFPLDFHLDSELATEAALAAGEQGKFWEMHDILFSHQSALKATDLHNYAEQLHLDMHAFDEALSSHRFAGQIAADRALGTKAGVSGTPTFFVDGHPVTGALSLPQLNQLADAHAIQLAHSSSTPTSAVKVVEPTAAPQQVLGPAGPAPVTLTWFVDVRSPLVGSQAELLRTLEAQYKGQIRVLFRAFPLETHADGRLASQALVAALQQGKFWPMFDAIAERRDQLDRAKLLSLASAAGLDSTTFSAALDDAAATVRANVDEAARRGIQGAPVIFLNKQRVDGLQRPQFYIGILDQELGKAPAVQASIAR